MKITKTPDMIRASVGSGNATSIGGVIIGPPTPPSGPGQAVISSSSNTSSWQPVVSTITSNGSNVLLGPNVNFSSGSNVTFSVSSNTLFIHSLSSPAHAHSEFVYNTLGGKEVLSTIAATGSTETINLASGNVFDLTLDAATVVLSLTGATASVACSITVALRQDAIGGRQVTWPASVVWAGGDTPILTATPNAVDWFVLTTLNGGTTWYGFETGGGSTADGYWETVTNGNSASPECTYADGDIVVSFVET